MNFFSSLAALLVAFAVSVPLRAQESQPVKAVLPPVLVTAQRTPEGVLATIADVIVLERRDIESAPASNLIELLGQLPGVQSASATNGGDNNIYIRGAESRMTMLLIDGVRVDSQDGVLRMGGGAPWELIPLQQIDRIEVLKGPASTVYGADAMGGVIQVFTRRHLEGRIGFMQLAKGSHGQNQAAIGAGYQKNGFDFFVTTSGQSTDGYNPQPQTVHNPSELAAKDQSLNANVGFDLREDLRLEWTHLTHELDNQYLRWGGGNNYNSEKRLMTDGLRLLAKPMPQLQLSLSATDSTTRVWDEYPNQFETKTKNMGAMLVYSAPLGEVLYNLDRRTDVYDQDANGAFGERFSAGRSMWGQSLGWSMQRGQHALTVRARSDHDTIFGTVPTASVAYALGAVAGWRGGLSMATSYRAPTLEQIYSSYGDARLRPEKGRHLEMSLRYLHRGNESKVTLYRNLYEDLISSSQALTTCGAGFFCYYNIGQAEVKGATLSQAVRWDSWVISGSVDVLSAKDRATGKMLNMRAPRSMNLRAQYAIADWVLVGNLKAIERRYSYANESNPLAGYATLDIQLSKTLDAQTRVWLKWLNATDRNYDVVSDYRALGRTWLMGLNRDF